jgi:hypothetical protein
MSVTDAGTGIAELSLSRASTVSMVSTAALDSSSGTLTPTSRCPSQEASSSFSLPQDPPTSETDPEYIHHAHRPIGHHDILDTIMDICEAEKAYGTIALFGSISPHHHELVGPRLRRIRKRVVLILDDYRWEDKDNYGKIE